MSEKKRFRVGDAVVNLCTMSAALIEEVVDISSKAAKSEITEMAIAAKIKEELAAAHGAVGSWQVIVGRNFGSFSTSVEGHFTYFFIGQMAFCIWAA